MSWFNLDDGFYDHPKFESISDSATALWARVGAWCAKHATDGVFHLNVARRLSRPHGDAAACSGYVSELLQAKLWERVDYDESSLAFHEWSKYQRTKQQVEHDRDRGRQRKADYRKRVSMSHGTERGTDGVPDGVTTPVPNAVRNTGQAKPSQAKPRSSSSEPSRDRSENSSRVSESQIARAPDSAPTPERTQHRRPPPPAPPDLEPVSFEAQDPWLRVWQLYEQAAGLTGRLGHPVAHRSALTAIAGASAVESGESIGPKFERATQRLLRAWLSDPYVKDRKPPLSNLEKNLQRYALAEPVAAAPAVDVSKAFFWESDAQKNEWDALLKKDKEPKK